MQSGYLPRDPSWCRGHGPPPVPPAGTRSERGSVLGRSAACARRPWRPQPAGRSGGGAHVLPPVHHATTHAAAAFDWSQTRARPLLAPPPVDGQAERAVRRRVGPPRCQLRGKTWQAGGARWLPRRSVVRAPSRSLRGSLGRRSGRRHRLAPISSQPSRGSVPPARAPPSSERPPRKVRRVSAAAPVVFKPC